MEELTPDIRRTNYANAVESAIQEFEELLPKYEEMGMRILNLRRLISSGSALLNRPVLGKHQVPRPSIVGQLAAAQERGKR